MFAPLAVLPVVFLTAAAPVPKEHRNVPIYFPTKVGAQWVYQESLPKPFDFVREHTEVVTAVEDRGGTQVVCIGIERLGKVVPDGKLAVSRRGIARVAAPDLDFPEPTWLLKVPARPGDAWDADMPWYNVKVSHRVRTAEVVVVPAGRYSAVRVDTAYPTRRGDVHRAAYWFAPGVGLVKLVMNPGERNEMVRVLKSFRAGKD